MSARHAFICFGKPQDLDVDVPRLLELSRSPLDTRTRIVHDSKEGFCGGADLIVAVLAPVMEAYGTGSSLPVSVSDRGLDAWTYG